MLRQVNGIGCVLLRKTDEVTAPTVDDAIRNKLPEAVVCGGLQSKERPCYVRVALIDPQRGDNPGGTPDRGDRGRGDSGRGAQSAK